MTDSRITQKDVQTRRPSKNNIFDEFIIGADFSTLPEVESLGGRVFDFDGNEKPLEGILAENGYNYSRILLWNRPYDDAGNKYGAGTNDLDTAIGLSRRSKAAGMNVLLDFQYSDFWADPGKQFVPKDWRGYGVPELIKAVHDFTLDSLKKMKEAGAAPDMVQVGNEITNGMLWPYGDREHFENVVKFVNAGIDAVREVLPNAYTMIHLDSGNKGEIHNKWFDDYFRLGGNDFDIIGLSYYPLWNGPLAGPIDNMAALSKKYDKPVIMAEVSQLFTTEDYRSYQGDGWEKLKGSAAKPELIDSLEYPATKEGQEAFMRELIKRIKSVPDNKGLGFFYWEPAWVPIPNSGWANEYSLEYIEDPGPGGNEWADQALFDFTGHPNPALKATRK